MPFGRTIHECKSRQCVPVSRSQQCRMWVLKPQIPRKGSAGCRRGYPQGLARVGRFGSLCGWGNSPPPRKLSRLGNLGFGKMLPVVQKAVLLRFVNLAFGENAPRGLIRRFGSLAFWKTFRVEKRGGAARGTVPHGLIRRFGSLAFWENNPRVQISAVRSGEPLPAMQNVGFEAANPPKRLCGLSARISAGFSAGWAGFGNLGFGKMLPAG